VSKLSVWLGADRVGLLAQEPGRRLVFRYDAEWLGRRGARPLSLALPLREPAFPDETARPFFSNLLPEGGLREAVRDSALPRGRHWERFAGEMEIGARLTLDTVVELASAIPPVAAEVAAAQEKAWGTAPVVGRILEIIRARSRHALEAVG
jgi:HipA-like protein